MKQIVTHLLAIIIMPLMLSACEINNSPKLFFSTIDEAMRYEPQSPNDTTPYIYCKYLKRDTVFDKNGKPIKEIGKEMNDIVLTLGNDTIFIEIPIKIDNATLDFYTQDKLFAKDGSEAKDHWEFVFKKLKSNIYYITTEKFPISNEDGVSLVYPPSITITAIDYNYYKYDWLYLNETEFYSNEIEYNFDEVKLVDSRNLGVEYDGNEPYFWSGEEHQKEKFMNWLQYNSIFEK